MTDLFRQLFQKIDLLIELGDKAASKKSVYGIKNNRPTKNDIKNWSELMFDIKSSRKLLEMFVQKGIKDNINDIDSKLCIYRELSRRMDFVSCYWSAYYDDIEKTLHQVFVARKKIDKKYHLGNFSP